MFTPWRRLVARVRAFFTRADLDREFEQEMESHLAMLADDNVGRGMTREDARRAALVRLGLPSSLEAQHRDVRGLPAVDAVLQDLRFACRMIARGRWFSAAAIAALALGIGANTVGFTLVNGVFLRPLPFPAADRLYTMSWQNRSGRRSNVSHAELEDWQARSRSFQGLAAYRDDSINVSDDRALPAQLPGTWLTANSFGILGQPPLIGRDFTAADERPGADPVVLIGYRLWRSRYGGDPTVVGRVLRINGRPAAVVGVMPDGMRFPDDSDLWAPLASAPDARTRRNARLLRVFGRLGDGVERRAAHAELSAIGEQSKSANPAATRDLVGVRVETFTERFIGGIGRPMFLFTMGAVVLVLLVACANVANLLLSRSAARAREIAIRTAIGATRWRIVRQLLVESLVLAGIGGGAGLALAAGGVKLFAAAMSQSGLPYWVAFPIDFTVFVYVAGICALTAVLFGLAPALYVSKTATSDALKEGGHGSLGSRRARRFSTGLVVAELALTTVLLAGAGLMIRGFVTLYGVDIGVAVDRLTTMRVRLPGEKYGTPEARRAFYERLEPRLGAIPGVEAAAITTGVPGRDGGERLLETDAGAASGATPVFVSTVAITPRFFAAAHVPILRGRNLHDRDGAPGAETVIVNEDLAARFFPGEDPIGRQLRFSEREPAPGKPPDGWRTIVGVSGRILHGSSIDRYVNSVVYIPFRQEPAAAASLLVRSLLPPNTVMAAVGREVQAIDRDQPVSAIRTLEQLLAQDRWWFRIWGGLLGSFAAIALVLSSVGVYAVMAYSVTERTQEIGVRMAVGASRRQVCWLILGRGLRQVTVGLTLGVAGAVGLHALMRGGMFGLSPADPLTLAGIAALVAAVALTACLVPARRATRVDPVVALRAE